MERITVEQRLERLEGALIKLCDALQRKGTERDGNWGYPPFAQELVEIKTDLAIEPTIMKTAEGHADNKR